MPALSETDMPFANKSDMFGTDSQRHSNSSNLSSNSEFVGSSADAGVGSRNATPSWQHPSVVHDFRNQGTDLRAYLASLEKESRSRDARIADLKNLAEFLDSQNPSVAQEQNEPKLPSESRRADSRGELGMNKQGAGSLSEAAYSNLQGTENLRYALNSSSQEGQAYHTSPGVESLHEDAEHSETGSEGDNDEVGSTTNTPMKAYLNDLSPQRYQSFGADHDASDTSEYSDSSEGIHMEAGDEVGGAYSDDRNHDLSSREALLRHLRFLNSQVGIESEPVEVTSGRDSVRSDLSSNMQAHVYSSSMRTAMTADHPEGRRLQENKPEVSYSDPVMPTFEPKHQSWSSSLNDGKLRENLGSRENLRNNHADLGQASMHYVDEEDPHSKEYHHGLNHNRRFPFQRSISENISAERANSTRSSIYEYRAQELQKRLSIVEAEAQTYADSLAEMHHVLKPSCLLPLTLFFSKREKSLRSHIERLQIYVQKLEASRNERDMLTLQLGTAYEEIAMRDAALADSAAYMQALKRRNAELQIQLRTLLLERNQGKAEKAQASESEDNIFGLAHIRSKIEEAVKEAAQLKESERKDKIKQLRIRWHPDKNPVLQVTPS
ncbi:hypothetical protein GUITHDRAFT_160620 [Guillardia theta CCMP2712]|uniref:J domain-containing protein n=1 Tax=Guillardia theta (strain CCMP2712) TaxID=905079 RepID=L1K1S0_GUITC|nr:hypothetical protein GUITHDRAFT_160620 [Guillardia theta CCMP2712]EKX54293.1 hypothetical protein GUITHDRAFT_160620 [Guillardia theta CCMP2712]|eukprot:XP_005841273.1 hypothetical protein GUITHDRAFT_160620 [Guillardia theta CCMP2712]